MVPKWPPDVSLELGTGLHALISKTMKVQDTPVEKEQCLIFSAVPAWCYLEQLSVSVMIIPCFASGG